MGSGLLRRDHGVAHGRERFDQALHLLRAEGFPALHFEGEPGAGRPRKLQVQPVCDCGGPPPEVRVVAVRVVAFRRGGETGQNGFLPRCDRRSGFGFLLVRDELKGFSNSEVEGFA